ncbi:NAD(P)H-binding domain-containing protein [Phthorimaea operculella]|nr:NAD(P)H-binding domain-containing protein [Phthorimaea operculella]
MLKMVQKVVIFGATGNTGLCATEAAVKKGLQVRAFVRDPKKLPADLADKVEVFEGNVLEPDSVNDAIEGMDAVVICLGTRNSLEPTSDSVNDAIEGMDAVVICLGTRNSLEPTSGL